MPEDPGKDGRPLQGKKIVVTRARGAKLADSLEKLGAEIIEFPTIEITACTDSVSPPPLDAYDWIVFTSATAVALLADQLKSKNRDIAEAEDAKLCAVGPATASALDELGLSVDLRPDEFVAESIVEALKQAETTLAGKKILLPRGNIARKYLPMALKELGADVRELVVYKTERPEVPEAVIEALVNAQPDLVTFTSASTARNFCEILGEERLAKLKERCAFVSIGPQTTAEAQKLGIRIEAEPQRHDVGGLVDELVHWYEQDD